MCRILLAEDNDNLREVMTDYLSDNGFTVDAVADGMAAWDAFCERDYRLVLLDVMMPKMNGFDVCRRIRAKEDVPVLFLTARVQEEDQLARRGRVHREAVLAAGAGCQMQGNPGARGRTLDDLGCLHARGADRQFRIRKDECGRQRHRTAGA